jgi:hypothetical protein
MPRKMILPDRPLTGAERQQRWQARQDAAAVERFRLLRRHATALKKITQANSLKEARQLAEWALLDHPTRRGEAPDAG